MSDLFDFFRLSARISRCERLIEALMRELEMEEEKTMATQETLDRLVAGVAATKGAEASARKALDDTLAQVKDLSDKLQQALAGSDEDAIKQAAQDLEDGLVLLQGGTPAVAAAVAAP
jgi:ABC-type transporter Mla subunit MlaD